MRIDTAKERCPDLVLIAGEDLTPYREASDTIFTALSAFGPCQKLGLDEFFLDVTASARAAPADQWAESCHVHCAAAGTRSAEYSNCHPEFSRIQESQVTGTPTDRLSVYV